MTREEQKKFREQKEYLKVKSKEYAKQFALKKKDYMFYHSAKQMFYCMMFFMKETGICISFYAKPLWMDDILWDILKMSSNKKEPVSLRSIGAYTIHSNIKEYEETFQEEADIERIIQDYFGMFKEFAQTFDEAEFLKNYQNINWQQEIIQTIVLIHENKFAEALEYLADKEIRDFVIGSKNFTELAVAYIKTCISEVK